MPDVELGNRANLRDFAHILGIEPMPSGNMQPEILREHGDIMQIPNARVKLAPKLLAALLQRLYAMPRGA